MAPKSKPTPRKALKRPTGELSKSNSKLAKFIKGSDSGKKFTGAEARTVAGKYRDMEKAAGGFRTMDSSGVALGKAEAAVKKIRKPAAKKTTSRGPKAGTSTVASIAKRFGVTAREARDIATAIGGIKDVVTNRAETGARGGTARQLRNAVKNVATQYKETAVAAATGKPGKPAKKYLSSMGDNPQTFYGQKKRK